MTAALRPGESTDPWETIEAQRAKAMLVEIVRAAGEAGVVGRVRMYKAYYDALLTYFRQTGRLITSWPVVHMPFGPGVEDGEFLLTLLTRCGALEAKPETVGPYTTQRYTLGPKAAGFDLADDLEATRAVGEAVAWVESRTTSQLTQETHELSRAWQLTREGEDLPIALDVMTDQEYAESEMRARAARKSVGDLFPV